MALRAVRGATQVDVDTKEVVLAASRELVEKVAAENGLAADDFVSITFTATKDIVSVAPALAARQLGYHDVALICAQEMHVEGGVFTAAEVDLDTGECVLGHFSRLAPGQCELTTSNG